MCKCLYCYQELEKGQKEFHPRCARKFFRTKDIPSLEYTHDDLDKLAEQVIRAQTSLTGVQPKLSLNLNKYDGCTLGRLYFQTSNGELSASTGK